MIEAKGDDSNKFISSNGRLAMHVYSIISGKSRNEGNVISNETPTFHMSSPISASSLVENTGNVHTDAEYIMRVFPLFSDEEVYSTKDDPATARILPETRHFNTIYWEGSPKVGIFNVEQTVIL